MSPVKNAVLSLYRLSILHHDVVAARTLSRTLPPSRCDSGSRRFNCAKLAYGLRIDGHHGLVSRLHQVTIHRRTHAPHAKKIRVHLW
jgi:hypothetical protein